MSQEELIISFVDVVVVQGDPGESRFYIALDDDLMKIFGGDMVTKVYNRLGADEDMPLQMRILSNAVESAQKKVEGRTFLLEKMYFNMMML